jgi:hypothetical protein
MLKFKKHDCLLYYEILEQETISSIIRRIFKIRNFTKISKISRTPEDVADPGTRDDLQGTSTHPESKGQLQVLSSPNVQPWIVLA